MNREERRKISKDKERIDVTGIVVHFKNGQYVNLDIAKAQVVDKFTGRPLFDEVLESVPAQVTGSTAPQSEVSYTVEFETPEGTMIFVKEGNWSGVKKK